MTVTHTESVLIDDLNLRVKYSSSLSSPLFYVLKNGKLYTKTYATEIVIPLDYEEDALIEVFDTSDYQTSSSVMDRRMEFDWESVDDVDYYRIDYNQHNSPTGQHTSSVWCPLEPTETKALPGTSRHSLPGYHPSRTCQAHTIPGPGKLRLL